MDSKNAQELQALRKQMEELDARLLGLVAERQAIATRIGRFKAGTGRATRDYAQEKEVIERATRAADGLGLNGKLAEEMMLLLIQASLTAQEQHRVQEARTGGGKRVLIIGGAGKMGGWFARFLASQGFAVEIADPAAADENFKWVEDWPESRLDQDLIIVATPLGASCAALEQLARHRPPGVVCDIGSLKTPLRPGLRALSDAGVRVTSIHPMFGPDTEMLSGRHVIFVDMGVEEATSQVRELFRPTMAVQVEMDLESHDRLIAYILGLSHALNIAFFTAVAESGEAAPRLAGLSSTTFDAQLEIARRVAWDNPHLYYEIQALNDYGTEALSALLYAVERVRSVVRAGDEAAFVAMMDRGRAYLGGAEPRQGRD
jgi:chorismate mutase/prephenate dehydrogenase